ncbi:MAG: M15 family metallopeptidase [Bacteroidetes bacterium]|nr:M15 family metallopeptidase [Bacteroidota bacterium]
MVTPDQCIKKYGKPDANELYLWSVPAELNVGVIPKRIYCNMDTVAPLEKAFSNLIERGYIDELKTWDGCFNIRQMRGGATYSLHSWGIAVDVNARENGFGQPPKLTPGFVQCFTDAGFDWGGKWKKPDGMHFQLSAI